MEALALSVAVTLCALLGAVFVLLRQRRAHGHAAAAPDPAPERTADALARALLPSSLPIVDGLRLSWSYRPASRGDAAGGDFFDAFFLDDETLALAIGEASGQGVAATLTANVVRQALRSALIDGARPADALRRANRVLLRSEAPGAVTAIAGTIDPATLLFRYASAGHPAPALASADGYAVLPVGGSGIALGVLAHHVSSEHVVPVPVDGLLALATDGFTDLDRGAEDGTGPLAEALIEARALAPSKPAVAIDRALLGEKARDDDAAIVTIVPERTLAHVDVRLAAEASCTSLARTALRRFFAGTPLDDRRAYDALVAACEAVSNAIEHAYEGRPNQTISLRARHDDDGDGNGCIVFVEDRGRWREPEAGAPGRGLALMRQLSDGLEVEASPHGTCVVLRFAFARNLADAALT